MLHNTAEPNLAQWAHSANEHQRILNLNHYYKAERGWHSGPHLFISPSRIWVACDLAADGVHCSCWNRHSIGVEMVGDYATESFDSGDGAEVRDNAAAALAILHNRLGLRADNFQLGVSGLHLHRECVRDHHNCPGPHVDKADMVFRVVELMKGL